MDHTAEEARAPGRPDRTRSFPMLLGRSRSVEVRELPRCGGWMGLVEQFWQSGFERGASCEDHAFFPGSESRGVALPVCLFDTQSVSVFK